MLFMLQDVTRVSNSLLPKESCWVHLGAFVWSGSALACDDRDSAHDLQRRMFQVPGLMGTVRDQLGACSRVQTDGQDKVVDRSSICHLKIPGLSIGTKPNCHNM